MKTLIAPRIAIILLLVLLAACKDQFPEKVSPIKNFGQLQELFADPPADYRSAPLWDWNYRISKESPQWINIPWWITDCMNLLNC